MRIEVLGPVRLSTDAGVPVEVAERHLRLLLVSLVAADGDPVSADALSDRLWDEGPPTNPKKVLRAKISRLRTVLDEAQPGARGLLTHTPAGYRLAVDVGDVDADRFKRAIERARRTGAGQQKRETLQAALELWRGEPYGDAHDETWLAPTIAGLRDLRGDALESLAETLLEQGEPEQALSETHHAVTDYPTRERLISAVMLALYQVGRQHEALEMFESLRRRLADDLGVDPSPDVRELHGRLLRQESALAPKPSSGAAPRSGVGRSNVPAETAPLIGRRHERQQITTLLDASRLVTLTGIGGVGKTRLALHIARDRQADTEHGVWFIDLSELPRTAEDEPASGDCVTSLIARVLDLPEETAATSGVDRLCEALGSRSALLVLDNCEHVIVEAAVFVAELLRKAPGVRVMTTSREPLGLPEEHRYDVGTLNTEPSESHPVSEAVEFFVARARTNDPTFHLDEVTTPTVTELCRRLDGLPLALELAAARIRGISVRDLLERIGDRLSILHRPGGRVPRRQQTLRGMIEWSWSLLGPPERAVLRRLAVHPGSFTLAAAEAICGDEPENDAPVVKPVQVADVLIGLVDRSMVRAVSTPNGTRYGLLESIAVFAEEKLVGAGERERVARRHLDFFVELANEADRRLRGPEQRRCLARLDAERTQLRNAFDEAARSRDGGSAVALTVATFLYHWIFGRYTTIRDDLRLATDLPGPRDSNYAAAATLAAAVSLDGRAGEESTLVADALSLFSGDDFARARVQWFAGISLLAVGVREAGEHHVDEASDVLLQAGEDWDLAVAACQRDWFVVSNWGDPPRGLPDGRDPERVLRDLGDGYGLMHVFDVEHRMAELDGDQVRAAAAAQRALEVSRTFGLWGEASFWSAVTAIAALRVGEVDRAAGYTQKARSLADEAAGGEQGARLVDLADAMIARYQGELSRARTLLDRWTDRAGPEIVAQPVAEMEDGFLAVQLHDPARAEEAYRALHPLIARRARPLAIAGALELVAAIRVLRGEAVMAAELLGTAASLRARSGVQPSVLVRGDIDRVHAMVRGHLTAREAAEAFDRGRNLEPDVALKTMVPSP